jgi:hypothetical protein
MKKWLIAPLILAIGASAAFGQITVSGWGQTILKPLVWKSPYPGGKLDGRDADGEAYKKDQGDLFMGQGVTWGSFAQMGVGMEGKTDSVGFFLGLQVFPGQNNDIVVMDNVYAGIWVRPFKNELLTIQGGAYDNQTLRGTAHGSGVNISSFSSVAHEPVRSDRGLHDDMFRRFDGTTQQPGIAFFSRPISPLFLGVGFRSSGGTLADEHAARVFRGVQAGAAYNIPNAGLFRVQYVGAKEDNSSPYIQAAFKLAAVANLFLDIGVTAHIPVKNKDTDITTNTNIFDKTSGYRVSVAGNYQYGKWTFEGRAVGLFMAEYKTDVNGEKPDYNGLEFSLDLIPIYNLGVCNVGMSLGMTFHGNDTRGGAEVDKSNWLQPGGSVFVRRGLAGGNLVTGISIQGPKRWGDVNSTAQKQEMLVIGIPISLEYSF